MSAQKPGPLPSIGSSGSSWKDTGRSRRRVTNAASRSSAGSDQNSGSPSRMSSTGIRDCGCMHPSELRPPSTLLRVTPIMGFRDLWSAAHPGPWPCQGLRSRPRAPNPDPKKDLTAEAQRRRGDTACDAPKWFSRTLSKGSFAGQQRGSSRHTISAPLRLRGEGSIFGLGLRAKAAASWRPAAGRSSSACTTHRPSTGESGVVRLAP